MGERAGMGVGVLKRRGLLAGAAAIVAGGLARLAGPGRAEAAHNATTGYTSESVMHADFVNTTTSNTLIKGATAATPLVVQNASDRALYTGSAVYGVTSNRSLTERAGALHGVNTSDNGHGVVGCAEPENGVGVTGLAGGAFVFTAGPPGTGVFGFGPTNGVAGRSPGGNGARGESTSGYGAYGLSQSGPGVFGGSNGGSGVYANSNTAAGVFATGGQKGVWGRTDASSGIGVFGQATGSGFGIYGAAGAGGWAGYFEGNVYISGGLAGGDVASSLVQARDGSRKAVYSVDSTAPVVEDFGTGMLANGQATIALAPEFTAVIGDTPYMVFLTEEGDHNALYIGKKSPAEFVVRAKGSTTASSSFSYRVVATRREAAGAVAERSKRPDRPTGLDAKGLEPPKLPEAVAPPEKPAAESKPEGRDTP